MDTRLYVVSGFMRTGTSMMMASLMAGGLEGVYRENREEMRKRFADEYYDPNSGGLFEMQRSDYNSPDFPNAYAGKLIKCLFGGLMKMREMPGGIRVVYMRRNEEEIRQSYMGFFGRNLKIANLQKKMDLVRDKMKERSDMVSFHEFQMRNVVSSPRDHFQILADAGWPIDVDLSACIVDPTQYRYRLENLTVGIV